MAPQDAAVSQAAAGEKPARVSFATSPEEYKHWKLTFDGNVARLAMDVTENATLNPGYDLKLNSYDLGSIGSGSGLGFGRSDRPERGP